VPPFVNPFRVIRPEDLLVVDIGLSNLRLSEDGQRLERIDPEAPAGVSVVFPPQHVAERGFMEFKDSRESATPPPVQALMAGSSRLSFSLTEAQASIPFTIDALLGWASMAPRLAGNALPPDATEGPAPGIPADDETAIEFPYRLILSPDANGRWEHQTQPLADEAEVEVWHTRLVQPAPGPGAEVSGHAVPVRAVGVRQAPDVLRTSLTLRDLRDIVLLSSDFSVRPRSRAELGITLQQWGLLMRQAALQRSPFVPVPLRAETLMLTALGASARLRGHFDYPLPDQSLKALGQLGMPTPSLEQYEHVTGLGRDQFVRVVRRGFLCTG